MYLKRKSIFFLLIAVILFSHGCGKRMIDLDTSVLVRNAGFNVGAGLCDMRSFLYDKLLEGPLPIGDNKSLDKDHTILLFVLKAQNATEKPLDKSFFNENVSLITPNGDTVEEIKDPELIKNFKNVPTDSGKLQPGAWLALEKLFKVENDSIRNDEGWKLKINDQYYRFNYELINKSMDYIKKNMRKK